MACEVCNAQQAAVGMVGLPVPVQRTPRLSCTGLTVSARAGGARTDGEGSGRQTPVPARGLLLFRYLSLSFCLRNSADEMDACVCRVMGYAGERAW